MAGVGRSRGRRDGLLPR